MAQLGNSSVSGDFEIAQWSSVSRWVSQRVHNAKYPIMQRTTPTHSSSQRILQPKMSIVLMLRNSTVDPGAQEKQEASVRPSEVTESHFSPIVSLPGGAQSKSRERD